MVDSGQTCRVAELGTQDTAVPEPSHLNFDLFGGWIPANLIMATSDATAWWMPQAVRPMSLRDGAHSVEAFPIWPALLCVASARGLAIAALPENARPEPGTALAHAPLGNVNAHGSVCVGNALLPGGWGVEHIAGWEQFLVGSAFTHPNHYEPLASKGAVTSASLLRFWSAPSRHRRPLPRSTYLPNHLTAQDFIARHAGANRA